MYPLADGRKRTPARYDTAVGAGAQNVRIPDLQRRGERARRSDPCRRAGAPLLEQYPLNYQGRWWSVTGRRSAPQAARRTAGTPR